MTDAKIEQPNWDEIVKFVSAAAPEKRGKLWHDAVVDWGETCAAALGSDFHCSHSENLVLCTSGRKPRAAHVHEMVERSIEELRSLVPLPDYLVGRGPFLVFEVFDAAQAAQLHVPSDECRLEYGVLVDAKYRYWVRPRTNRLNLFSLIFEDVMNNGVDHLLMPSWVYFGLRTLIEDHVAGLDALTVEDINVARRYWTAQTIQGLWSGASFCDSSDIMELAFTTSILVVRALLADRKAFGEFLQLAHYLDGGQAALQEVFGVDSADLMVPLTERTDLGADPASFVQVYEDFGLPVPWED